MMRRVGGIPGGNFLALAALLAVSLVAIDPARSADPPGLLETIRRHVTQTTTIPNNGDLNPYAVIIAPVTVGKIQQGDVLVDNFNNVSNLQGTGTTIISYRPSTKTTLLVAMLPQNLAQCPGGIGLTTAMTMLKSGWIIVGSTPSTDGTTRTKGKGCLAVLDSNGRLAVVWAGPNINGPWGNMATVDNGSTATLFISMAGFDVPGPQVRDAEGYPVIVRKATVLRLQLSISPGQPLEITNQTVVANGFGQKADKDVFLVGPRGLALSPDNTLYVSDAVPTRSSRSRTQRRVRPLPEPVAR
jgi:hypothetical protein